MGGSYFVMPSRSATSCPSVMAWTLDASVSSPPGAGARRACDPDASEITGCSTPWDTMPRSFVAFTRLPAEPASVPRPSFQNPMERSSASGSSAASGM